MINGRKLWITNGNEADVFIVFATVNPEAGYRGITAFIVERGMAGFTVGKKEDKLGIRASSTCELILEDCRVPKANVLGEVGKGYKTAIETLNEGRIGIGAQMVGLARGALDATIKYTKERKQFGKPIAEFQAVQHQIARAAVDVEAATLTVYNAARLRDAGKPFLTEAAICKIFSSEVAERVASLAVNLFGGNGFVKEYPVEKFYRDAKIGQIYEGHVQPAAADDRQTADGLTCAGDCRRSPAWSRSSCSRRPLRCSCIATRSITASTTTTTTSSGRTRPPRCWRPFTGRGTRRGSKSRSIVPSRLRSTRCASTCSASTLARITPFSLWLFAAAAALAGAFAWRSSGRLLTAAAATAAFRRPPGDAVLARRLGHQPDAPDRDAADPRWASSGGFRAGAARPSGGCRSCSSRRPSSW